MRKKFTKVLGVGLTLALLAGLLVSMVPASAGTLSLSGDTTVPYVFPFKTSLTSDVHDIAVNGSTIYLTTENGVYGNLMLLLKSTDAGSNWADLATATGYPTGQTIKLVAVAPDDADVVAIVYASGNISYSNDGGSSWSDLEEPASGAVINSIDISPLTGGYYYLAAGGTDGTDAELYTLKMSMAETWTARAVSANGFGTGDSVMAVKFSPNFDIDKIIACISENSSAVNFQVLWHESPAYTWNVDIGGWTGWSDGIRLDVALASGGVGTIATLNSASIAMPDSFLGSDSDERIAFVGAAGTTTQGGVSRLYDTSITAVTNWSGAALLGATHSIALNGEKLVAGSFDDNQVFRCLDALAVLPRTERQNTLKQPGGSTRAVVAWSGSKVVAGTTGDESAFSVSTDDGYAFNDVSMIDSMLMVYGTVTDMAISPDGTTLYVVAYVGDDVSVWVRASGVLWTRVLSLKDQSNTDLVLRLAPEDPDVVYLISRANGDIWRTADGGKTRWKEADCYKLTGGILDIVVESADVAYAIDASSCTKTSNGGASWGTLIPLKITGYTVTVASNGDVLVGGGDGNIAWSKDGGASFSKTPMPLGAIYTGNVHVLPDADYESNGIVYASNDGYYVGQTIYRGTLSTAMPILYSYGPTIPILAAGSTDFEYYGLAQLDGVVYAVSSNTTATYIWRALNLLDCTTSAEALWSSYNTTANGATIQNLKMSAGPKAWAAKTTLGGFVMSVTDPIAIEAPTALAPEDEFAVPVNPASGAAYDVTFSWQRYDDADVDSMQLQVATDDAFDAVVYDQSLTGIATTTISIVLGTSGTVYGVNTGCSLMPGTTYYWRVRTALDNPALSPWSDARSFTVDVLEAAGTVTVEIPEVTAPAAAVTAVAPAMGAMDVPLQPTLVWPAVEGATGYEIMVSEYADFSILEWSHTTAQNFYPADESFAYETTYFWRARASEPEEGAWTTGVFTTMAEPVAPEPVEPTIITVPGETKTVTVEVEKAAAIPSYLLWTIIAVGAVLVIALIVLIVRTRRVA